MTNYYLKYLKYKQKYLTLKKQLGGAPPTWLPHFIDNMFEVIPKLNSSFKPDDETYPNYFYKLAGSAGTILLAYHLNPELLNTLYEPNDIDIVAYTPSGAHIPTIAGRTPTKGTEISNTYVKTGLISIDTINVIPTTRTHRTKFININVTRPSDGETLTVRVDTPSSILSDYISNPIDISTNTSEKINNYNKKCDYLKTINDEMFDISEANFIRPRTAISSLMDRFADSDDDDEDMDSVAPRTLTF